MHAWSRFLQNRSSSYNDKLRAIISYLLFLCILNGALPLYAQKDEMTFEHLWLEQGLSDSVVTCIAQDRKGFLWVGTENGLNRYDGYTFTRYKHNPEDSYSLSSNKILSLHEDHLSVLWIGTEDGLQTYDRDTERFLHYPYDPDDPNSLNNNEIQVIHEVREGVLWVGTSEGLNRFDREAEEFLRYKADSDDPKSLSHNTIWSIYEDQAGVLWIGTSGGLNRFDRMSETFKHYPDSEIPWADVPKAQRDISVCLVSRTQHPASVRPLFLSRHPYGD